MKWNTQYKRRTAHLYQSSAHQINYSTLFDRDWAMTTSSAAQMLLPKCSEWLWNRQRHNRDTQRTNDLNNDDTPKKLNRMKTNEKKAMNRANRQNVINNRMHGTSRRPLPLNFVMSTTTTRKKKTWTFLDRTRSDCCIAHQSIIFNRWNIFRWTRSEYEFFSSSFRIV